MSIQEFDKIFHAKSASAPSVEGRLRFAPQGVGWKSVTGDLVTAPADQLRKFQWVRSTRRYQLRILLHTNKTLKFDNLDRDDHERVRDSVKANFGATLDTLDISVKGWNWGSADVEHDQLVFRVSNKLLFEVPFDEIANVNSGKNEVAIELAAGEGAQASRYDQLVECRLHVPGMAPVGDDGDQGSDEEGSTAAAAGNNKQSAAEYLCDIIKSKADLAVEKSDVIVSFKELPFLTPRGRYDVEMFKDFLRLRGKSYDYKIKYSTIKRLFMLPKPDDLHVMFVIGLDPPLRQGQTQYKYLVVQFVRDDELAIDLNMDADTIAKDYAGTLAPSYDAPMFEVVTAVFRGLTGQKILIPGGFKSTTNGPAIKCSLKANEGHLYPMERQLIFVPKPTTYLAHAEISYVTFSRVSGGSSRTIDMVVTMKGAPEVPLSNIAREEYQALESYFSRHGVKVKNELVEDTARLPYMDEDSDESDGGAGGARGKVGRGMSGDDDDDDESPDEDFVAESESESDESDYSSSGSEDDDGGAAAKKGKGKDKKRAAPKGGAESKRPKKKARRDEESDEEDESD
ncbi:hypothetical protein BCR44DRAFT_1411133 [Catenaria anguillulae PL171]|uniref:FACT complex subunit POB3 n=1 Tax=Catenaria anguillulae PL171 TaxID=765915 RepID=A0A1Y2I2G8_9FUNG|nr:hypothetical protein BCR44DRAFT_1411133 [Catenaria anguillulae PL171]